MEAAKSKTGIFSEETLMKLFRILGVVVFFALAIMVVVVLCYAAPHIAQLGGATWLKLLRIIGAAIFIFGVFIFLDSLKRKNDESCYW